MKNVDDSKKLLYVLTDVEDKYIKEAIDFADKTKTKSGKNRSPFKYVIRMAGVAACFVILVVGSHLIQVSPNREPGKDYVSVENSYQEVTGLSEAEALAGFEMSVPNVENYYSQRDYAVIDGSIIEVTYMTEDETAIGYYIRKTPGLKDISGDFNEYEVQEIEKLGDVEVTLKGEKNAWIVATWSYKGYSYAIGCINQAMTKEQMLALIQEVK